MALTEARETSNEKNQRITDERSDGATNEGR